MHPTLLHVGHLYLPTFGLLAALGLLVGMFLSLRTAGPAGVEPDALWNAGLFAIFAAFLSSRLLLVLFNLRSFLSAPVLLLTVPSLTAMGLLLTVVATTVYLRRQGVAPLRALDAWAVPGAVLWSALALGHLAEGSDPGLPTRFGLRTSLAGYREQPVALYAALLALLVAAVLWRSMRRPHPVGEIAGRGLVLAGLVQFGLCFWRIPYRYDGPTPLALLDPLQWVALGMVLAGGGLLVFSSTGGPQGGRLANEVAPADATASRETAVSVPAIHREHSMHAHQAATPARDGTEARGAGQAIGNEKEI